MGIKNFIKIVNTIPEAISHYPSWESLPENFRIFAVDIPILVYSFTSKYLKRIAETASEEQLCVYLREEMKELKEEMKEFVTREILQFCLHVIQSRFNRKIVAVFDGPNVPEEKRVTQQKRTNVRETSKNNLEEVYKFYLDSDILERDEELIRKLRDAVAKASFFPKSHIYKHLMECLSFVNITCVQSYGEGEKCASFLNQTDKVEAVISTDMDCIAFGCRNLITQTEAGIRVISFDVVRKTLSIDTMDIIHIAILSGCDYTDGIRGMGPLRSLKHVLAKKKLPEDLEKYVKLFLHDPRTERHSVKKYSNWPEDFIITHKLSENLIKLFKY